MSDRFDLRIVQGERLLLRLRWELDGTPLALPGAVRWQIRQKQSSTSPLILDLTPYLTVVDGLVGVVDLDVPAAITRTVTATRGYHDCFAGDILWFQGGMSLDPAVTTP